MRCAFSNLFFSASLDVLLEVLLGEKEKKVGGMREGERGRERGGRGSLRGGVGVEWMIGEDGWMMDYG